MLTSFLILRNDPCRHEDACGPSCAEECQQARLELQSVEKRFEEQLLQQKKQACQRCPNGLHVTAFLVDRQLTL